MKKLISILISIIIMVQMLALPVFAEESNDAEYWSTMVSFGVVDEELNKSGTFTIAEMSEMLYYLLNLKGGAMPEATRQIYTDVDRWHWAAGYIEWLYNNSVYTGDGTGIYEPERTAMLSDVCTVMLNLLGYQKVIEYANETADAIKKAIGVNLLSSHVNKTEHEITYNEFASICYELLFTDVIEAKFSTETGFAIGGEFVEEILKLKYDKGIVTGANGYSLTYESCGEEYAIIDGNKFFAGEVDFSEYIGYNVKYYYDNEENLIAAVPVKNEEIIIASTDILGYTNNKYSYKVDRKRKTAETDTGVMVLYNGKPTTNRNAFQPAYGQVRLIDNDNDGEYECVISENAVNIVLEKAADGIIYGKNADSTGKKYAIDTKAFDLCKIIGLGDFILEELKADAIITAVISEDGKYATLYVTEEKQSGVLTSYDLTDGIVVGEDEYEPAAVIFNPNSITSPGNDVVVLLDVYGNVAAVIGTYENKYVIGYLMSAKVTEEETLLLKILTSDSVIKKIECSDKLNIDGAKAVSVYAAQSSLTVGELIKYRMSGDKIRYIDTATWRAGTDSLVVTSDTNSFRMFASGTMLYKSTPQVFKKYGTMSLYSEFAVTDDTLVFFVPSAAEYKSDSDYYVGTRSLLGNDLTAEVAAYVTGAFALAAEAAVVTYTTSVQLSTGVTVVDSISTGLNSDDEIVSVIKGMSGGKEIEITVSDASLLEANGGVEKGSVIRYRANKNGEVKAISHLYGIKGTGVLNSNANHTYTAGSSGVNANVRMVLGRIAAKNGTVALFEFKDNAADKEVFNLKNCNFYVYSQEDGLRSGSADDIYDFEHYGAKCDEVVICTRAVTTSDVILIRR